MLVAHARSLHELDDQGNVVNAARVPAKGFRVGDFVERKIDGKQGRIHIITASHVRLEIDGNVWQATAESFVKGDWKQAVERKEAVQMLDWHLAAGTNSKEFQVLLLKGDVMKALAKQRNEMSEDFKQLEVFRQPRDVKVKCDIPLRNLVLPCTTTKVGVQDADHEVPQGAILIGKTSLAGVSLHITLTGATSWPCGDCGDAGSFLSPAWLMRTTPVREDANMEIVAKATDPFSLPTVRNFKRLLAGTPLLLHRPVQQETPETLQPMSKKHKGKP